MKNRDRYLYIYLKDMLTNPHLRFDLHLKSIPDERASYAKTAFNSLKKEEALDAVERVEDVGFWCLTRILSERRIIQKREYGMIVYADFEEPAIMIAEWPHKEYSGGECHTFLPLPPFPKDLNLRAICRDPLLQMRLGRIVLNALLD